MSLNCRRSHLKRNWKLVEDIIVNTRWAYKDDKGKNAKSLPDYIQIDLELEDGKLTMNLIKSSVKSPLIMTQFEGRRSVWKPSDDEVSILNKKIELLNRITEFEM